MITFMLAFIGALLVVGVVIFGYLGRNRNRQGHAADITSVKTAPKVGRASGLD